MPNFWAIAFAKNGAIAVLTQRDRTSPKTNQRDRRFQHRRSRPKQALAGWWWVFLGDQCKYLCAWTEGE
jgi:hypothetical protein